MLYNIQHFGHMITDAVRMNAYAEALRRAVQPGSVVVDIGAGMGIFAFIACQLGAKRVYAIESNPLVEFGEQMAASNGFSDRIEFIRDMSTSVTLPELADVVVADLRGQLPLYGYNLASLLDARQRLLKPEGILIPQRDHIYVGLLSAPETYRRALVEPWQENIYNLDMTAVMPLLLNHNVIDRERPVALIAPAQKWVTLEYGYRENPNVSETVEFKIESPGTAHFVSLWFDAELMDGIGYSNAPNQEGPTIYGRGMLPLEQPIELEPGDTVIVKVSATFLAGNYEYVWETRAISGATGQVKANYQQSTYFSATISEMRKRASSYVPRLQSDAKILSFILNEMSKEQPLSAIAQSLHTAFPKLYPTENDALRKVAAISQRYSN